MTRTVPYPPDGPDLRLVARDGVGFPVSDRGGFALDVLPDRDRVVVLPHGDLDAATAPTVEREVAHLYEGGHRHLVLDLHDTDFMDLAGIRMLLAVQELAVADAARCFELAAPAEPVLRILALTNLSDRFVLAPAPR
jgi:anti-sigma B factor antagonist